MRLDLFHALAHELRTPITSIYAGTKLLTGPHRLSRSSRTAIVQSLESEAERLYRFVEDLIALAAPEEAGRAPATGPPAFVGRGPGLEPGGPARAAESAGGPVETLPANEHGSRSVAGARPDTSEPVLLQHLLPVVLGGEIDRIPQVRFRALLPAGTPPVVGDEASLRHALRNVIGMAADASLPGTVVEIVLRRTSLHRVTLAVLDGGETLRPADDGVSFPSFPRSDGTAQVASGRGLALAAAQVLVAANGGTLVASARRAGGTRYSFTLPIVRA